MSAQRITLRISAAVLKWALRLYPREARAWGEAILAEVNEISEPAEALVWTLGGLTAAFRLWLSACLRHRGRGYVPDPGGGPPSWKFAAVCLMLTAALLLLPPVR